MAGAKQELILPDYLRVPFDRVFDPKKQNGLTVVTNKLGSCVARSNTGNAVGKWHALTAEREPTGVIALKYVFFPGESNGYRRSAVSFILDRSKITHTYPDGQRVAPLEHQAQNPVQYGVLNCLRELEEAHPLDDLLPAGGTNIFRKSYWEDVQRHPELFGPVMQEIIRTT